MSAAETVTYLRGYNVYGETMLSAKFQEMLTYPTRKWGESASDRWVSLCTQMRDYQAPCRNMVVVNERKWELVSALQKSIRRGDKQLTLSLVSAIDSMSEEYAYFWKRFCVIACEDVGPADDLLAAFVIACATVFSLKKTGHENYDLLCFLSEQMCDLSTRSRVYCSYSIIDTMLSNTSLPDLSVADQEIISAIMQRKASLREPKCRWEEWLRKNDWRGEQMLRFIGLTLPVNMTGVQLALPEHKMLFGFPSYCYDMHTRVGLEMLRRIVRGVRGTEEITDFLKRNKVQSAHRVVGDALFFVEGGRIQGELIYGSVCCLEQRLSAHRHGLSLNEWLHLQVMVVMALESGIIDRVREDVLRQFYGEAPAMERSSLFPLGLT
jgi:hypothetical protein